MSRNERRNGKYRAKRAVERNRERARKRKLKAGAWRDDPASEKQWQVLRKIGRKTGRRFPANITKGEASDAVKAFHSPVPSTFVVNRELDRDLEAAER